MNPRGELSWMPSLQIIAAIEERPVIARLLAHLGLPTRAASIVPSGLSLHPDRFNHRADAGARLTVRANGAKSAAAG